MQHIFDRGRCVVFAGEHPRMVGICLEGVDVIQLGAGTVKARHGALTMRSFDPAALCTKLETRELWLASDDVDRGKQLERVHAVARRRRCLACAPFDGLGIHDSVLWALWPRLYSLGAREGSGASVGDAFEPECY